MLWDIMFFSLKSMEKKPPLWLQWEQDWDFNLWRNSFVLHLEQFVVLFWLSKLVVKCMGWLETAAVGMGTQKINLSLTVCLNPLWIVICDCFFFSYLLNRILYKIFFLLKIKIYLGHKFESIMWSHKKYVMFGSEVSLGPVW